MKIEVLVPDTPKLVGGASSPAQSSLFSSAYDQAAKTFDDAQSAEARFASGSGTLLEMTTARATADMALSTAVAITSKISQLASTLGNMSL